ncbi:MAG: 16S rRNA (adenine(1518)-N(6)/adenine(1519)-N(6))-dimethyltransferase RsmA [Patescibacteria group bacterium]
MTTKKILKKLNLKPNKFLGQNFLVDKKILEKIIKAADLKKDDIVLEAGPGTGFLTEKLAEKAKIILAVEKDRNLVNFLKNKFRDCKNVKIINGDILKILDTRYEILDTRYKVVANIPYYITSRFLRIFLENKQKPKTIVILVQKEVAKRICAQKGQSSILSLSVQYYGKPQILDFVSKGAFYPKPKVDSAILKIEVFKKSLYRVDDEKLLFKVIKAAFSSRRKQLINSLSSGLKISKKETEKILRKCQISPHTRPQDLGLNNLKNLYSFIHKTNFEEK